MQLRVKDDGIEIDGYVNAVERKSRPLRSRMGQFVERICKGAFKKAIDRNDNIRLLLNHDWSRDLGGTKDGNLELTEDSIGLRARARITDPEVVEKGKRGDLVGWSFGFKDRDVDNHDENGMPTRDVKDLDLYEVSILDRSKSPAYDGTLVSVRAEDDVQYHGEPLITDVEVSGEIETRETEPQQDEEPDADKAIDYSKYEQMIKEMKEEDC